MTLDGARSFIYAHPGSRDLRIHVFMPADGRATHPAILFFFGGGWRNGSVDAFEDQAKAFAAHGFIAALADYRVACRDGTTAVQSLEDGRTAYAWLRADGARLGVDAHRMILSGGSSGGHLALATAMQAPMDQKPAALILFNPAVDLVAVAPFIGLTPAQAAPISPSALSVQGLPPTLIFHGQSDHTVPIATVRTFCARMTTAGLACELQEYQGQDHGFFHSKTIDPVINASPYDDTLGRALAFAGHLGLTPARP
jgi:acetyl esterase/lipase